MLRIYYEIYSDCNKRYDTRVLICNVLLVHVVIGHKTDKWDVIRIFSK